MEVPQMWSALTAPMRIDKPVLLRNLFDLAFHFPARYFLIIKSLGH